MFKRFYFASLVMAGCLSGQTASRDFNDELEFQDQTIKSLKQEIVNTRRRIENETKKERTAARNITNLEEEISLLERLISRLKQQKENNRWQIQELESEVGKKEQELKALRERYKKRVVNTYKHGSLSSLEKILSSASWRQAVYRTRYLKLISDIDKQTQKQIYGLLTDIKQKKSDLELALQKNIALVREQNQQARTLRGRKLSKEKELVKIRKNKKELSNYINEKREGIKQLEDIRQRILEDKARFEREERIRRQQEALSAKSFNELRGNLLWPAEGRVIVKFGRQWNSKLKTTTENPGIDIKGKPGSQIRTVMNGVVTTITYIRGYGTTIIVDHGGGFYTVYSHVTNLQTNVDSEVRVGDIIAYMGDSGSVNGSKLHFEIWGNGQKLNPEKWLQRK